MIINLQIIFNYSLFQNQILKQTYCPAYVLIFNYSPQVISFSFKTISLYLHFYNIQQFTLETLEAAQGKMNPPFKEKKHHTYQCKQILSVDSITSCPYFCSSHIFNNVDELCLNTQTSFKIIRKVPQKLSQQRSLLKPQNPYVFTPKSYSTRRHETYENRKDQTAQDKLGQPKKKVKKDNISIINEFSSQECQKMTLNLNKISKEVNSTQSKSYFNFIHEIAYENKNIHSQTLSFKRKNKQSLCFPIHNLENHQIKKQKNSMLKKSIDIISNKNTKISVPVHQGLLNANTNKKKLEKDAHCFQGVLNPYNLQRFNYYSRAISFAKDYKNGYAPIELQRKNNDDQNENYNESNAKNHFIRKKQSTLTLPRTCGVSYIRPSESHQDPPFDPLPPLVFQCSSACSNMKEERQKYQNQINVFINMAQKSWLAYIRSDENHMRNLLLGERIGTVGWVQGIQNIWPLLVDGNFLLLLFCKNLPITEEQVWSSLNTCSFKIGILCKKSTSGKKSFLKSVGIQASAQDDDKKNADNRNQNIENEEIQKEKKQSPVKENPLIKNRSNKKQQDENYVPQQEQEQSYQKLKRKRSQINSLSQDLKNELKDCRTVLTLSLRLQLYVTEKDWKQHYTNQDKNMLNLMINCLKEDLQKKSLSIIKQRFDLSKIKEKQSQMSKFLLKFKHPIDQVEKKSNDSQTMTVVGHKQIFSVETMNELFGQMKQNKLIQQVELLNKNTKTLTFDEMFSEQSTESAWEKYLKMPIYYISTRDSFAFDLIQKWTTLKRGDRQFNKIQYFFDANNLPTNFTGQYKKMFPNFNVGVTCYYNFFTNQELKYFEQNTFKTEEKAFKSSYLQMTVQPTITNTKVKRTKFFFGYRYMWTSCQLAESTSYVAAGVRKDVTQPPKWTKNIQNPMVEHGIVEKDFLNSIAINVYHDGKQGLAQHFDDAVRFKQPIYTLRLFSDARLSFGSQFYGFCNGAFIIPLPRGCICVMQQNSYAANGVKHCVRPCDMTGKSAAVILRQMHHQVIQQAAKYDQMIDFPAWMSTLLQRKYEKKDINKSLMKKQEKSKNSQDKEWKDIGQQNKKIKIKQNSDKRDELIAYTYAEQKKRVVEYLSNERSETILN